MSITHLSILIAALGVLAMADRVFADEQTAAKKTADSVVAEGISSNPGAFDVRTGTGELADSLEKSLGLPRGTGVSLAACVADANCVLSGGADPGKWSFNRLLIVGAGLDAEKLVGWPGGRFGVEFLQFNGEHTNRQAGSVQGYNCARHHSHPCGHAGAIAGKHSARTPRQMPRKRKSQ